MFFLNYILFILLILFVHVIALSTQSLSSKKYFFGVYVNEIIIEEDSKTKINKDFKRKLNILLFLSMIIYMILKSIFNLNIGANIIISTTVYFVLFFFILKVEFKKVKDIKDAGTLAKKMVNKLITYKADSKGDISTITFAQFGANAEDNSFQLNSYASTYEYDEDNKEIRIGGSTGTRYDVTEDTVVFFIKGSGDDTFTAGEKYVTGTASKSASKVGTVASLAEAKAVTGKPAAVFDDDNGVASVVVLWNSTGGISPSNSVAVISSVGTARIDEEAVESVEYYMNGELKTSYTDPDYNGFKFADDVKEGDIVKLALSADGTTITDASKVFIADRDYNKAGVGGALTASTIGSINNVIYGPVYDYTSMNKRIRVAKGADFTNLQAIKANNANVYVFDPNRRNNKIEVGDASDVEVDKTLRDGTPEITVTGSGKTGVAAGEKALGLMDYAVGVEYDGDIIDVVIYKAFDFDWKFAD